MNFEQTDGFYKNVKGLGRKYKSLPNDIEKFRSILSARRPVARPKHTALLKQTEDVSIWKMRLFCEYLKGNSLRVVFAYFEDMSRVVFLEMYYKGDKEREDVGKYECFLEHVS